MAVTADKYELPVVVEESASELANKLNVTRNTVYKSECYDRVLRGLNVRIVKVSLI